MLLRKQLIQHPPEGGLTFRCNYLAALAVMLVCPVCKNHHQQEASKCQRCDWSMKNDLGIDLDHEILTTCIPTILKSLKSETANNKKLQSIIQKIELQEADSHKLDEILDEIENDRQQTYKHFEKLSEIITELKSSLSEVKNKSSDITIKVPKDLSAIQNISSSAAEKSLPESNQTSKDNTTIKDSNSELLGQTDCQQSSFSLPSFLIDSKFYNGFDKQGFHNESNSLNITSNEQENSLCEAISDLNSDNDSESINELQEASLYDNQSDRQSSVTANHEENVESSVNSSGSYQSFYHLIKRQEIEYTEVKVPQETVEQMRSGTQSELKFSNARKGNYWIVNWQGVYCLIPKEKLNINPYQYGNFQRVFNCQDYQESYIDFEIVKPARVINCDAETWRLESKGKIKFI